jgi:hypothetical protein
MPDLIRQEINPTGLTKRATNILEQCDRLISVLIQKPDKPDRIHLTSKQYKLLAGQLEKQKQDIRKRTYRGFRLMKAAE